MSSAVNLMSAVNVEGPVGAIRRNRVELSVVRFMPVSLLKFLGGVSTLCFFLLRCIGLLG